MIMAEIPLGAIDRLIRKNGINRVSVETAKMLREILEDLSKEIIVTADSIVKNRNKKVINKSDIQLAYQILRNQL